MLEAGAVEVAVAVATGKSELGTHAEVAGAGARVG